ncbi:MAG TPA: N-formylglutamate deformylase [Rhizomicrobium sp.]|nr:N-formylglutamate deformylase [Rhizomicrobium sp.]
MADWLTVARGEAPLIVSLPHTGTEIPGGIEARLVSPWLARKDTDWHVEKLYDFAPPLGATVIRTAICRTVIDCNRDPSGRSLYPGQATTELCPTTSFDGEPLYRDGEAPDAGEIADRRARWFEPYHAAIEGEIARLRARHARVVLFDAHSIRSRIPRLFDGELPHLNFGSNDGASCDPALLLAVESAAFASRFSRVTDGRFKGGWTTRNYGKPESGVHVLQLELAIRSYLDEPDAVTPDNWPAPYRDERAAALRAVLARILEACVRFSLHT